MTLLLPIFGVAFAAFCVWLGVRIFNRRERWAKWTAAGLAVLVAYPVSLGPACWISSRLSFGEAIVSHAYRPIVLAVSTRDVPVLPAIEWYSGIGAAPHWKWDRGFSLLPDDANMPRWSQWF